ncbi:MAG TPA: hypothetical protein VHT73_02705 [Thermodesulfobacteriota bacterium]|nr:hypothetical protein [Thermodesulfobacteriota bacterium]
MAITTPLVTDKFTAYPGDVISTNLSLAVWLVDDYTQKTPAGYVNVKVKEGNVKAVKNLSGYYLFTDLPSGNYTVVSESGYYFSEETPVNTSLLDPKNPVLQIILKPRPAYPFPGNATLVRGRVSNANPVANAVVKVVGKTIETKTDERGEFVLYFTGIKQESISIEVTKDAGIKTVNTTVEEGKTVSLGVISFP